MTTYGVTAVSWNDERVPLTAGTNYSMAHEIAQPRSNDDDWYEIEIRESETGKVIAKYADGVIVSGSPR